MRILPALVLGIALTGIAKAAKVETVAHRRPPTPAGISFKELEALGARADSELIKRFADPKNERYRSGLLARIRVFGNQNKPNPEILDGLKLFVEHEVAACQGQVEGGRIGHIGSALSLIGQRGGTRGTDYLKSWVTDKSVHGRLKCFSYMRDAEDGQDQLRRSALLGIGLSGTKESMKFLTWVGSHPPVVKYSGSFMGVLNVAVAENTKIQKDGIEKHLKDDRAFMLSYRNDAKYDK